MDRKKRDVNQTVKETELSDFIDDPSTDLVTNVDGKKKKRENSEDDYENYEYDEVTKKLENFEIQRAPRQLRRPQSSGVSSWASFSSGEQARGSSSHFKPSIQVNDHYHPLLSSHIFGSGGTNPYLQPPNYLGGNSYSNNQQNTRKEVALFQPVFQQNLKAGPQSSVFTYNNDVYTVKQPKIKATTPEPSGNYAYFHIGSPTTPSPPKHVYKYETTKNPFIAFSTVGGFFNNINKNNNHITQPTPAASAHTASTSNFRNQEIGKIQKPKPSSSPLYDTQTYFNYFDKTHNNGYYNPTTLTTPPPPPPTTTTPTTTERASPNFPDNSFYSNNPYVSNYNFRQPSTLFSYSIGDQNSEKQYPTTTPLVITTRKTYSSYPTWPETTTSPSPRHGYYITKSTTTTTTHRPDVFSNLDFDRFVDDIRDTHLTQVDPNLSYKLQKIRDGERNASVITKSTPRPFSSTFGIPSKRPVQQYTTADDEYYDDDDDDESYDNTKPQTTKTTYVKPFNSFVGNSIQSNPNQYKQSSTYNKNTVGNSVNSADDDEYYYDDDEYEDDDDDDVSNDDRENKYQIPTNKSKFMPMTETMAPKPANSYYATSTRPTFSHSHLPYSTPSTVTIPPIITFPEDDIFKMIKPHYPRYLNQSTLRPYTMRTRIRPTLPPTTEHLTTQTSRTTTTTIPTTTTTQSTTTTTTTFRTTTAQPPSRKTTPRKVYTVRPNRGRGTPQRWKTTTTKRPHLTNSSSNNNNWELDENLLNR